MIIKSPYVATIPETDILSFLFGMLCYTFLEDGIKNCFPNNSGVYR